MLYGLSVFYVTRRNFSIHLRAYFECVMSLNMSSVLFLVNLYCMHTEFHARTGSLVGS